MKITAHCLLRNEDIWVWYALSSVLPYVEKVLVNINGSTDKTLEIVKSIKSSKIETEEVGFVDETELVDIRRKQLKKTTTDWFLILDGDEIWPEGEIKKLIKKAEDAPKNIAALVNKTRNCVGDIYHYQPESSGQYQLAGHKGNLNIRLIRKTGDLDVFGQYPLEVYTNRNGPINAQENSLLFVDSWYLHTTYLKRSSIDHQKTSGSLGKMKIWEKGLKMGKEDLPKVLFDKHPLNLINPLGKRGPAFEIMSQFFTPLIAAKRKIT